jgi:two-component system nitrogen regulation sensor histidine kinase NtrY
MANRRSTLGWLGLALLLAVGVWGLYRLVLEVADLGPDPDLNQLLLPALSLALVVLALALAGVLIRNLVRLIVDRKRGILGSRLRTKLVFFFLALILLPATILFTGSAQVIKQTVEAILRTPLEELTRQFTEIVDETRDYFLAQSLKRARALAAEIHEDGVLEPDRHEQLEQLLDRWQRRDDTQLLRVTQRGRVLVQRGGLAGTPDEPLQLELEQLVDALEQQVAEESREATRMDYLGQGLLAHAAIPLSRPADGSGRASRVVSVAVVLPTRLTGNLDGMIEARQAYRQFRAKRRELVRLYLTLIGLIFLMTLFVATWLGFYLSRRITVPLQQLAAASREISAGNLDVRVRAEVGDEMGMLVDAFNEMAAELQENREVISRSTSDLRRSNKALDERRRYIETLVANLSTAVFSLGPSGRLTTANPAVREILGVELRPGDRAEQVLARRGLDPLAELLDPGERPRGEGLRRDLTLQRASGRLNLSVQVSPLRGRAGEDLGTLVMVEDLTELLRAQRASAWREIARRIAHEIKNPLTPIQLAAQRLRKKFSENASDLDKVLPEATAAIEREVGALKAMVDEFSKFARMPEVAPREVDLTRVVESVLALYKGLSNIRWEVELSPDADRVTLDPEQMRRVLINLIDNAVAAMDGKGTIRIATRVPPNKAAIRIEVTDTGPGIPGPDRDRMFSPYFSTKHKGTGLGLAIVHRVVTDHQGTIQVEANEPSGARFVIEIPLADSTARGRRRPAMGAAPPGANDHT